VVLVENQIKEPLNINTAFEFLLSDDNGTKNQSGDAFIPSDKLFLPVDAAQVIKTGTLPESRAAEIVPQIDIKLGKRLTKSELMILEMLRTNNWERPIYFAVTVGDSYYMGLDSHFELTGMAYQILPVGANGSERSINVDETYDNMMTKFRYGNIDDKNIYLDENTLRMCKTHRMMFAQLVGALIQQGDSTRALKALDYSLEKIPGYNVRHDYVSAMLAEDYYKLGQYQKGDELLEAVAQDCVEYLDWYFDLKPSLRRNSSSRISHYLAVLRQIQQISNYHKRNDIMEKYMSVFERYARQTEVR
jgi:tetratricopeptide (TPR) repeat protein